MPVLTDLALKGTLVLLAALLGSRLLRHDSAATRHLVWSTALASLLLLPLAALVVPAWRVVVPAAVARWVPGAAQVEERCHLTTGRARSPRRDGARGSPRRAHGS